MVEEIRYHVVSDADSRGFREAAADLDKTSKAARGLRGETDKLGESFDRAEDDTFDLSEAIDDARRRAVELRAEFARTGDSMALGQLRTQRSYLAQLEKVRTEIDAASGGDGRTRVTSSVLNAPNISPPRAHAALIAVLVGAAVAAAPTIGAMLSGVVAGAIGTVGVAGGVAMAAKDPGVKAAFADFTRDISAEFFAGGSAFVMPTIRSLHILEDAFRDMDLGDAFAKMAPLVEVIASGLGQLGRNIMPGLNTAFDRMGPFADVAAKGFADLGSALGQFMRDVTASKGTVMGLKSFFDLLNGLILATGKLLRVLSEMYEDWIHIQRGIFAALEGIALATGQRKLAALFAELTDHFTKMIEQTPQAVRGLDELGGGLDGVAGSAEDAAKGFAALHREAQGYYDFVTAQRDNQIALERGLDDLAESVAENGRSLDITNEKGRTNVGLLADMEAAARRTREENIKNGVNIATANILYDQQIEKIRIQAEKLGFSKTKVDELLAAWRALSTMSNIELRAHFEATGTLLGEHSGLRLPDLRPRGVTTVPKIVFPGGRSFQGGGETPGGWAPFQVHRDEWLWSDRAAFVATKAQMMRGGGGGGGASRVARLVVAPGGGGDFERFLAEMITRYVRAHDGDGRAIGITR